MRLYYHPLSSNSRRVLLTAVQLGMPLQLVVVDLLSGEHKTSRYLRINPNGKVPLLDDDGFHLWESHAIMQYLADACNGEMLYPHDIQARADINRWLFWSAYHYTPAVGLISRERVSKSMVGGSGARIRPRSRAARRCSLPPSTCSTGISPTSSGSHRTG